ncbi:MAG: aspartate-alanine antiporter [Muribaculaceae bacterium]|nr:aspartate-alanine antiporter [Muribaculaceae bacterium]
MIENVIALLREYPVVVLFLTVGLGFLLGKVQYKGFSLGNVTSVLIVAVIIGQLDIPLSGQIKNVFFMMFLFSIGYSVGPQFFRSLKGMGLKQVLFAVLMSSTCFGATVLISKLFSFSPGETVGLFSGSQTCSSLLGVGGDAISNIGGAADYVKRELDIMPVCYAVTYIFGTLGTVIILGLLGPKLLGGKEKVIEQTKELEAKFDETAWLNDPVNISAMRTVAFRALKVENEWFDRARSVLETEQWLREKGKTVYIDRIRRQDGEIDMASPESVIHKGDRVVVCGRREYIVVDRPLIGTEVDDDPLLKYPVERVPVLLASKELSRLTVGDLRKERFMRGVVIEEITRGNASIPVTPDTQLRRRDVLTLVGRKKLLRGASEQLGFMDLPTTKTDIMFLGLAIFIGGFFGCIPVMIDGIPISFGTSGGSLIAGLVFGWLRTRRPTYGSIPESALWLMNHLGLNMFIAVIGIDSAPSFITGIQSVGWWLLIGGAIGTMIPLFVGLWLGHKVFKFNPALTLGCCAGTRTCTAALGAVQDALGSTLPAMGYTVTYAVSNIMLVIWGLLSVIVTS